MIIGLVKSKRASTQKRLFSYDDINGDPVESVHTALSAYLFDASSLNDPHVVVREESNSINGFPKLISGSKPIDGGNFIFSEEERNEFLAVEPGAERFMRPYIGSREYLQGGRRWILSLQDASPGTLAKLPLVRDRLSKVRKYRLESKSKPTQKLAETPTLYHVNVVPSSPYLVLPEVSSERREYVPIGWLEPPTIPSNLVRIIENASKSLFVLLTSAMHMSWLRHIGGRLKSDYRYSIGLVYNTFPISKISDKQLETLEPLADAILDARKAHPNSTLADLYDPDLMPPNLRKAHQMLDRAVDRLYRRSGFSSDRERVEHLLGLYEKLVQPLQANSKRKSRRKRQSSAAKQNQIPPGR